MTDQKVADRYISPGGRMPGYSRTDFATDIATAASFLVWAEHDGALFGMERASDAFAAFCRLLDVDGVKLRKIARGET